MSDCKACDEPLVLRVDEEDDEQYGQQGSVPETVPDDLELRCGCHFHWQCLMDESPSVANSLNCPSCDSYLLSSEAGSSASNGSSQTAPRVAILAQYTNEGGVQTNLDIMPSITEEAYVQSHPEALPARALHVMCAEGDVSGIIELLHDTSDDEIDPASLILYQDPLADMKSSLHQAVENMQEDAAWLLLWLSSTLSPDGFPPNARMIAESLGVGRLAVGAEGDVRNLRDNQGRTAGHVAQQIGGVWEPLLRAGILTP